MSGVLRQAHKIWQNYGIVTQHDTQTSWQNKNTRLAYLDDIRPFTL